MSQSVTADAVAEDAGPDFAEKLAIPRSYILVTVLFGVVFLYYSYIPLYHSDIWGHVIYGEWMLENGQLPEVDPYLDLVAGVPVTCTAWLGQVIFGAAFRSGEAEHISIIFGVTNLAMWLILTTACYLRCRSIWSAVAAAGLCWIAAWSRHAVVRPEIFGSLCFAALLLLVTIRTQKSESSDELSSTSRAVLFHLGIGLLFALWANLHGSYIVGIGVLGCQLLGRAIDAGVKSRTMKGVLHDRECWRWLVTCEVALLATLVNPYGIDLLIHTIVFPSNPNLRDVLEWFSLEMVSYEGIEIGCSWIVLAILLRFSRVSFRPADVLMLSVFCLATVMRVRMQAWYAPIFAVVIAPHIADVYRRLVPETPPEEERSPLNACLAVFVIWVCFAISPASTPVLGCGNRPADQVFNSATPHKLTEFLRTHSPGGQVLNPQWWGDWLAAFGPRDVKLFMTTNAVHVAPRRVWQDYMALARVHRNFEATLDRYRVNTIVVHKELQVPLARKVRYMPGWKIVYEDDLGLIVMRDEVADMIDTKSTVDSGSVLPRAWLDTVDETEAEKGMVQR